jgi:hypothetical protein
VRSGSRIDSAFSLVDEDAQARNDLDSSSSTTLQYVPAQSHGSIQHGSWKRFNFDTNEPKFQPTIKHLQTWPSIKLIVATRVKASA